MPILLQINSDANWGSTGKIAEMIGQTVMAHGWESYITYGREHNPSKSHLIKIGSKWNVYLHFMLYRFLDLEGLGSILPTLLLIRKIKKIKPDIVHFHNLHGHYLNYLILIKYIKKSGVPVVWTLHDCWTVSGHCYLFEQSDCERWKSGCSNCPKRKLWSMDNSRFNYQLKKRIFTSLDNVNLITVSNWMKGIVAASFLSKYPVKTIYNGIDINVFKPTSGFDRKKWGVEGKDILLAVASNWVESKGYSDFFKLADVLPDNYKIVLVGVTEDQIRVLPPTVTGIKRTHSQVELAELYSAASIVLSLSYGESMGLTPIEGMACGTPAIVYKNTAQPELITPETGKVVQEGNIPQLLESIKELSEKIADEGEEVKKACILRASKIYEREARYLDYFSVYNRLLTTKMGGG